MPRGARVALVLVAAGILGAVPSGGILSDLRIRSNTGETVVEALIDREARVEDRTRGVRPGAPDNGMIPESGSAKKEPEAGVSEPGAEGSAPERSAERVGQEESTEEPAKREPVPVSTGETFAEGIRIGLPDTKSTRSTSVIVGDPLVSEVRVLPEGRGSVLVIFVRQPVRYEVWRVPDAQALRVQVRPSSVAVYSRADRAVISGQGGEQEVTVDAETVRYDQRENVIVAKGGVAIKRPGTTLTADEVRIDRSTHESDAAGDVVLRTADATVRGDYVHLNLADETGWIESGEVEYWNTAEAHRAFVSGDRVDKGFGQAYRFKNASATTCQCGGLQPPSWCIKARRLDVDLLGRGTARHMTFHVRDVPVLYWPFGVFPVNKVRQSGFLMPHVGQSFGPTNNRGFQYEQPFYWAISKTSDATVSLDLETRARVGGVAEYRYALGPHSRGTLAGLYASEDLRSDEDLAETLEEFAEKEFVAVPPDERWGFFADMRQDLPRGVRAYTKTMLVSDDLFFTEIDNASFKPAEDMAAGTPFYTATRVGVFKAWEGVGVWGESSFFQDLNPGVDNEDNAVFHRLPGVDFRARRSVFNDRVVLSIAGETVDYQRQVGFDGLRLDLQPKVEIPFQLGRVAFGWLEGGLRETMYHLTDKGELRHRNRTRELLHLGARIGTEISRAYPFRRWGYNRIKHTIEPTVSYLFVPQVGGQDELPLFDGVDRVNRRSLFSYGMVSRLKAKVGTEGPHGEADESSAVPDEESGEEDGGESSDESDETEADSLSPAPTVRELARFSVLQVFDTQREIAGSEHVSDVDIGLELTPSSVLALRYGATYNLSENQLKGTSVTFSLSEPWQSSSAQLASLQRASSVSLSYRFVDEGVGADPTSLGLSELDGSVYLRLGRFLGLGLYGQLDLLAEEREERSGAEEDLVRKIGMFIRFISRCECWLLETGVEHEPYPAEETRFSAKLTLVGIGELGSAPGEGSLGLRAKRAGRHWP